MRSAPSPSAWGCLLFLAALTLGIEAGWTSAPILVLFGLFFAMLFLFVWQERRAVEPGARFLAFQESRLRLFDPRRHDAVPGDVRGELPHRLLPAGGPRL